MTLTDTEKVEFIHKISKNIRHGRRTFFDHLLKTSGIVEKLCEDINKAHFDQFPNLTEYNTYTSYAGQKYIKIITDTGNQKSVWGFINAKEFKKGLAGITFLEGDILKAAGWKTPALNAPRGNLFNGYDINPNSMRLYGPDYLR